MLDLTTTGTPFCIEEYQQKVSVVFVYATKTYRRKRVAAPLILHLDTRWRRVVNLKPRPLYPGERTKVLISVEGGVGHRTGLNVLQERKMSCHCRDSNPESSHPQPAHYTN
jgi:hypothetical protein